MKKTILITGGFGLIGSRLGEYLANDYQILLGSRKQYQSPQWLLRAKTIQIDWRSIESLKKACLNVEIIIHASGINAQECLLRPDQALTVNGIFTENLVKAAIDQGVKQIVYLSSAHVYRSPLEGVITEHDETLNSHPYATSNIIGENSVIKAIDNGFIDGFIVRLSNAFGAPLHKDANCWMLLVTDLCRQAITKKRLTLYSSSEQLRDFVTIYDVCASISFLLKLQVKERSIVINVGSGKTFSIYEMALRIQKSCDRLFGYKPIINKGKPNKISRVIKLDFQTNYLNQINFHFTNNFDDEIERLLYFCKENFNYDG